MEIHKPKPVHNWRDFLKEVGTIVLGVCIALAAEQTVEWWHWRSQVAQTHQVIAGEIARNIEVAVARLRTEACTDHRLDELAQIVDDATRTGSLPPVGATGITPRRVWSTAAWDSLVTSETASHFSRAELAGLGDLYAHVQRIIVNNSLETQAWSDLSAMVGPGRRLDAASDAELRKALSGARTANHIMSGLSSAFIVRAKGVKPSYSGDDLDRIAAALRQPLSGSAGVMCRPMGAVPPHYGQAALSATDASAALKGLPDLRGH